MQRVSYRRRKSAGLAVFLSLIAAGLGQIYLGSPVKGIFFILLEGALAVLSGVFQALIFVITKRPDLIRIDIRIASIMVAFILYNLIDAFVLARKINKPRYFIQRRR
ncbi:MAG TPA: hypothetical protein GXX51_05520 [Firmicutes bacterium]|nr:hypothetical protein [Bacillota bacterium]